MWHPQTIKNILNKASQVITQINDTKTSLRIPGLTVWAIRERIWNGQLPVVTFPEGRKQYTINRTLAV